MAAPADATIYEYTTIDGEPAVVGSDAPAIPVDGQALQLGLRNSDVAIFDGRRRSDFGAVVLEQDDALGFARPYGSEVQARHDTADVRYDVTPIPAPGMFGLFALGVGLLVFRRHRRRTAS